MLRNELQKRSREGPDQSGRECHAKDSYQRHYKAGIDLVVGKYLTMQLNKLNVEITSQMLN